MCLFVKQIKKYINIHFNFNNFPLASQSKEISSDSNRDVCTDQHVQSRSDDSGATMQILRGLKHGRMVDFFKYALFLFYTKQTDIPCQERPCSIHFKSLKLLFKIFLEFF